MQIIELKIEHDDTPKTVADLVEYLQTMACVHPDKGTRQMPTKTDDAAFEMAAKTIERLQKMVKQAYIDGFSQGMREHTSSRGGTPWHETAYPASLDVLP